jgi:hypothetical protein
MGIPERVVRRFLAARPIPIDKGRASTDAYNLQTLLTQALRRFPAGEPLGSRRPFIKTTLDNMEGQLNVFHSPIQAPIVQVGSAQTRSPSPLLGGSFEMRGDQAIIHIDLNGMMTPAALTEALSGRPGMLMLRSTLLHEITHALDKATKSNYHDDSKGPYGVDPARYYNDPSEVRAYMQQIVDDVLVFAERARNKPLLTGTKLVSDALRSSPRWMQIRQHLTKENTALMLKAVYRALADGGYDIGGSDYGYYMSRAGD